MTSFAEQLRGCLEAGSKSTEEPETAGNPLEAYSEAELLAELMRRQHAV